jgi:hypothetical protein
LICKGGAADGRLLQCNIRPPMLHCTNRLPPALEPAAMYPPFNEALFGRALFDRVLFDHALFDGRVVAASRQFADAAARINRVAIDHAGQVLGLQLAAIEQNARATFAFLGEVAEARDPGQLGAAWPKGLQVARDNAGRAVAAGQETLERGLEAREAIAELAKGAIEAAAAQAPEADGTAAGAAQQAPRDG